MACVCGTAIAVAALSGADAYAHPRQIDIPVNVSAVVPPRPDAEVVRARMLPNGYVVIVDSQAGFNNAGAITLYRDDGTLVSTLVGKPGDQIGFGGSITVLKSGNVLVSSPRWQCPDAIGLARCGAVTWISGTVGLNGTVDASNSLVGSGDDVGFSVFSLATGDYVVRGKGAQVGAGFVGTLTRGSGLAGRSGTVTAANSVTGTSANDLIGDSVQTLPNGDAVIVSTSWSGANLGVLACATPAHLRNRRTCFHAYRLCVVTPSRRATSPTENPRSVTCLTASILNSSVYRLLLITASSITKNYGSKMATKGWAVHYVLVRGHYIS
jgi:hypothetical protein